ncbi:hypothetical protein IAU60_004366 [Kwoniella sp. DSM 27419]
MRDRLLDTARRYATLGLISFGGPGVHVILLKKRFVDEVKWIDEKTFTDLFSLGNALPGPGSTQLAFSIAVVRHGVVAGLLAFLLWSVPGAIGMAALAAGIARIPQTLPPVVLAFLTGLNAAAVGLIALAAVQLAQASATDGPTRVIHLLSASFGICYHAPWMYPTLIASGGLVTLVWDHRRVWRRLRPLPPPNDDHSGDTTIPQGDTTELRDAIELRELNTAHPSSDLGRPPTPLKVVTVKTAFALLGAFVLLVTIPLATRAGLSNADRSVPRSLDVSHRPEGSLTTGWVSSRDFLLIFAILQAFPGPNFNFSVALGVLAVGPVGAVLGFIGIFSPGILLKLALLPLYSSWRDMSVARAILRGLNAAACGLVFTAVYQLFLVGYIYQSPEGPSSQTISGPLTADPFWAVISSASFVANRSFRCPPWLLIGLGGGTGMIWYAATSRNVGI